MNLRYEITWLDSGLNRSNGWETIHEILNSETTLALVSTVGYLIYEDSDAYFLAHSYAKSVDKYYGIQVISKKAVKKIVRMRER